MFTPVYRLALVLASIVGAVVCFTRGEPVAWLFLAAAALLALGYWRNASIWLAWRAWRHGDHASIARYLAATPAPNLLASQQRAYYEWLSGEVRRYEGDATTACVHFRRAVDGRLRTASDRAFALSRLAEAELAAGDIAAARDAIDRARALEPPPFVQALLRDLESAMAST